MEKSIIAEIPPFVLKKLSVEYVERLGKALNVFYKDPNNFIEGMIEKGNSQNIDIMNLPHPLRKKYVGFIPIHIELGLTNDPRDTINFLDAVGDEEIQLHLLIAVLHDNSADFRKTTMMTLEQESTKNIGSLFPVIMPHRHLAAGNYHFEVTKALADLLDKTDVGKKTPCGFLRAPYSCCYIECRADIDIYNDESGLHKMEGFYLNQFTHEAECVDREVALVKRNEKFDTLLSCAIQKGYVKKDGGDVRAIEVLFTGSPLGKNGIFDDATFNFTLLMQDEVKTVEEIIAFHIDHYTNMTGAELRGMPMQSVPMKAGRDTEQFSKCVELLSKVLLYINSDIAERREIKAVGEIEKRIKATSNVSKKRKLERQLAKVEDKIIIGSDSYPSLVPNGSDHIGRTVKTHWRRGHFKPQRYGKGFKDIKTIWIQPTLINSGSNTGPSSKKYEVR